MLFDQIICQRKITFKESTSGCNRILRCWFYDNAIRFFQELNPRSRLNTVFFPNRLWNQYLPLG